MNTLSENNLSNHILLNHTESIDARLGNLIEGKYKFPIAINNISVKPVELCIKFFSDSTNFHEERVYLNKEGLKNINLTFTISGSGNTHNVITSIRVIKGAIRLRLPPGPVLYLEYTPVPPIDFDFEKIINTEIDLHKPIKYSNNSIIGTETKVPMNDHYFKGFINLEEAERQLDFVIYEKLFAADGAKGFTKLKRSVYRKLVKKIYTLLTRNSHRKTYFAKLYRNYVNNNTLAENLHK